MTWITRLVLALAAITTGLAALVAVPSPALALQSVSHGAGYSLPHGSAWLGSYVLDDGSRGLCLQIERDEPDGHEFEYVDASSWYSMDDRARLAFIAREWAGHADADHAAAAQIATWSVTGFGDKSPEHVARVAGERSDHVLQLAATMNSVVAEEASRGVSATAQIELSEQRTGIGTVRADLFVDYVSRGRSLLVQGRHQGVLRLHGARFPDGTDRAVIENGRDYAIELDSPDARVSVAANVSFENLPYGAKIDVAHSPSVQSLLVARPGSAHAEASAEATGLSALPFQPAVETQTSAAQAIEGTEIHDTLELRAVPGGGLLSEWGLYQRGGQLFPIPVVIRSRLLGPFPEPIVLAQEPPADAPTVCSVQVHAARGPGRYVTPPCTIPAPGYYVWVETIDPADTPSDQGADRVREWASSFGVASEITYAPAPPTITSTVSTARNVPGGCLADVLHVSGVTGTAGAQIESVLVGPFDTPPEPGSVFPSLDGLPIAGTDVVDVHTDGDHTTRCLPVQTTGHYVFVFRALVEGSHAIPAVGTPNVVEGTSESVLASSVGPLLPAFADFTVYASESATVSPPTLPPTGDTTPTLALSGIGIAGGALGLAGIVTRRIKGKKASRSERS